MQRDHDLAPKVFSKRMQDVFVNTVQRPEHQALVGKNMVELGLMQGRTPLEAMIDSARRKSETQFLIHGFANGDETRP